jgi:hypothetical protein
MTRLVARPVLVGTAAVAAIAHVPVIAPHLDEAPYMGALFILFTVACAGVAVLAAVRPSATVFAAAAALCGSAIVTYAATRLVAFPQLADDVGSWWEPLGVVSVVSEALVVASALVLLRQSAVPARAQA